MHQESSQELLTSSCVTAMIGGKWDPFSRDQTWCHKMDGQLHGFVVIFVDSLQGSFRKNRVNIRHVLPGGLGEFFPAGLCGSFRFPWPRWAPAFSPKNMDVIKPTNPKKVIVEQLNHFRLLSANICTVCTLYTSWDFGKRNTKPKPLGHWVQYIIIHHHNLMAGIPHPRCWPGADSWTPSKDSAVFFSMFAWETDHRMELRGGR